MAGLYFDDFHEGQTFRHELTRTVTEADNTMFSLMSMNPQPLHIDAHFAEGTEWGQRLFNSMFTLAIMVGMTYVYLPLMVLPLYAAMERLDFRLIEAGYDLYATRLKVLWRIVIPLVKPGIVAGSILVFVPSLGAFVTPRVLGGGKKMMLGNLIELQFGAGRNWPLGAALSIALLAIVMLALLLYLRVQRGSVARP